MKNLSVFTELKNGQRLTEDSYRKMDAELCMAANNSTQMTGMSNE